MSIDADELHRRIGALEAELDAVETSEREAAEALALAVGLADVAELRQVLVDLHRLGVVPYCAVLDHESAPIPGAALVALKACVERFEDEDS